jgi:hypothetical protein
MIRTAVFRVAHTKLLDEDRNVYLCLLGDDVLEVLFGRVRMIGGHSQNVAADEFCNRAAGAVRLELIFQEYPKWERSARRLMLKRGRDADHLSPRHWKGELSARSCNLLSCWDTGISEATAALAKYGHSTADFDTIFSNWRTTNVDLLRPQGGKYPGISSEVDRSINSSDNTEPTNETSPDLSQIDPSSLPFRSYNAIAALNAERETSITRPAFSDPFVLLKTADGKEHKIFKKSALRILLEPSSDVDYHKSHDRLIRVRTFGSSIGDHSNSWEVKNSNLRHLLPDNKIFALGSLFATLISTDGDGVSLSILQCTSIKIASHLVESAPVDEISLSNSAYDIGGQILELVPFRSRPILNAANLTMFNGSGHRITFNSKSSQSHAIEGT